MQIEIDLPEDVVRDLESHWGNLSLRAAETLAIQGYREGILTEAQVQRMLNLPSRWALEEVLHRAKAYLDYSEADLDHDIEAIRQITSS